MKITDTYLAEIVDTGMDGAGVAKIENMPVFVPFAAKGDLCKIKIEKTAKSYAFGKLVKVVRPSTDRIDARCPYFGECGGCCLCHLSFDAENVYKKDYLKSILKKEGIEVEPEKTVSGKEYGYRNKLQMPFAEKDGKIVLGFYRRGTHDVVPLTECILHGGWAEKLIKSVTDWANGVYGTAKKSAYDERSGKGYLRHLVARFEDGFLSVTVVVNGKKLYDGDMLYTVLKKDFECALYYSVNNKRGNVILGDSVVHVLGNERELCIDGLYLGLSPMSFLQVNDEIRAELYAGVAQAAADSDVIVDVYSGAGIMTALLARTCQNAEVMGIEIVKEAVSNADGLMWRNCLDGRVRNLCGDAAVLLPEITKQIVNNQNNNDKRRLTTIFDPPRKGCDERVLSAVKQAGIDKIIYVSCNPSTLARDLKQLGDKYKIISVTPYNMFPRTGELETLAVLEKI